MFSKDLTLASSLGAADSFSAAEYSSSTVDIFCVICVELGNAVENVWDEIEKRNRTV